jgi:hypothetical protein
MTRREVLAATFAAGAASSSAQTAPKSAYYELRYFRMRTEHSEQSRRTTEFLTKSYVPAARRAGAGPIGLFGASIAPNAPFLLRIASYPSLAAIETAREKLAGDADYQKALADYNANPDPGFVRMESWLLRAFDSFPAIETGPADASRPARIFELRTYESLNESTLQQKIKMFGAGGEIGVFRGCGMQPVLFGEAVVGANMPHLSYMLAFENLAAREKLWSVFSASPDWQKLRTNPEYSSPSLVINISNAILTPVQGSDIR